jgi:drug/metabolite transporter (DMT)-like permease
MSASGGDTGCQRDSLLQMRPAQGLGAVMPLWIPITIAAAFLQNLRSLMQRRLKGPLSNTGATFVRFGFGLPVAVVILAVLAGPGGMALPMPGGAFFLWVAVGGLTQIAATALLLHLFGQRNFVAGTAYSRTEPVQAALFGLMLLGERAQPGTLAAIAISVVGVMLLSVARSAFTVTRLFTSVAEPVALTGLLSGALFGMAAVAYRAAALSLPESGFVARAGVTLVATLVFQVAVLSAWMAWKERDQFGAIGRAWKASALTGLAGALASFGWFMAMTLQQAAVVKALAQVEMLFALATSVLVFGESVNRREIAGAGLIAAGVVALLLL